MPIADLRRRIAAGSFTCMIKFGSVSSYCGCHFSPVNAVEGVRWRLESKDGCDVRRFALDCSLNCPDNWLNTA